MSSEITTVTISLDSYVGLGTEAGGGIEARAGRLV